MQQAQCKIETEMKRKQELEEEKSVIENWGKDLDIN